MEIYASPLKKWKGSFSLPDFDDFTGADWDIWRKAFEHAPDTTLNRRYAYAGLVLIEKIGEWNMEIALSEVSGWRDKPAEERMRLVSWIGRAISEYIGELIDPKG